MNFLATDSPIGPISISLILADGQYKAIFRTESVKSFFFKFYFGRGNNENNKKEKRKKERKKKKIYTFILLIN
mgnify:CR=1 FL=1